MPKMTEVELAEKVVDWLEGSGKWDVYQEVQFCQLGKVADIVAVPIMLNGDDPEDIWIIECKTSYGLAVLDQAYRWDVSYRSVAVPLAGNRPRTWKSVAKKYYQVGIIEVDECGVYETLEPPEERENDHSSLYQAKYLKSLTELHKTFAKAGSKGGKHLTNYKRSMIKIKDFLRAHPGSTTGEIVAALGSLHWSNEKSALGNMRGALMNYESDWCESFEYSPTRHRIKVSEV